MKKSDKVILIGGLALAGLMLGSALVYGAVQNIRADNARMEREAFEKSEEQRALRERQREQWKAYLLTPEGQAEMVKKREAAAAEAQRMTMQAAQQKAAAAAEANWQPSAWDGSVPAVEKWIEGRMGAVKYHSWKASTNEWKVFTTVDFTGRLSREVLTFTVMKSTGAVDSVKSGGVVIWPQ